VHRFGPPPEPVPAGDSRLGGPPAGSTENRRKSRGRGPALHLTVLESRAVQD
jgi:hypothetical protein